jgi:putative ABC transport system permease protein
MMLVLISSLMAMPIAWILMTRWLQKFAYRTTINPGIFVLSTLIILILVVLSIFYRTLKTARTNPVEALQYE